MKTQTLKITKTQSLILLNSFREELETCQTTGKYPDGKHKEYSALHQKLVNAYNTLWHNTFSAERSLCSWAYGRDIPIAYTKTRKQAREYLKQNP